MKNKIFNKRWLYPDKPILDCLAWVLENNPSRQYASGQFTIRIGFKELVIHSSNDFDKDVGLYKFERKLLFLYEKIDEFISTAIKHEPKLPNYATRYWLNPNTGSESEFTGHIAMTYDRYTATLTIASCDRSTKFYLPVNKENLDDKCYYPLMQIKLALNACISDIISLRKKVLQN